MFQEVLYKYQLLLKIQWIYKKINGYLDYSCSLKILLFFFGYFNMLNVIIPKIFPPITLHNELVSKIKSNYNENFN